jgi:hypothetical protein
MKRIFTILALSAVMLQAQTYTVTKINGNARALIGSGNTWTELKQGDCLKGHDIVETSVNSYIQLNRDGSQFLLKNDAAVKLSYIKKLSINDLLLALAMEEVKKAPQKNQKLKVHNTAVYGSKYSPANSRIITENEFGLKRLNGAKQLAESGYKESSIIAARETFRKYPATRGNIYYRLYFAGITASLHLDDEAYSEYEEISRLQLSKDDSQIVHKKLTEIKDRISGR